MPDDVMPQVIAHLFANYGPAALPIIGLLLVVKYLLNKDTQRETVHKIELEAEKERTRAERKRGDDLQDKLLQEAKGHADLAEEFKKVALLMAKG